MDALPLPVKAHPVLAAPVAIWHLDEHVAWYLESWTRTLQTLRDLGFGHVSALPLPC